MGNSESEKIYNKPVEDSKQPGFSSIYRNPSVKGDLVSSPSQKIRNLKDVILNTVQKYGKQKGIGKIILSEFKDQNGKTQEKRTLESMTFNQIFQSSLALGKSIIHHKLFFVESIKEMKFIGIHSKNRIEWNITDWACILFGLTSIPLYDTLGIQNLSYCLNQTEMTSSFVTKDTVKTIVDLKDKGNLKNLISYDPLDEQILAKLKEMNINVYYYKDLVQEGKKLDIDHRQVKISPQDCFSFSYTSGTTGPPKGAMISHANMVAFIGTVESEKDLSFDPKDIYISYLPLAHVMERCIIFGIFYYGSFTIIFNGNVLKLKDDCQFAKPTFLASVPRIYNRIYDAVKGKFEQQTGFKKYLIDFGLSSKYKNLESSGSYTSYSTALYDYLLFSKVKAGFGGNLKAMVSGSAPMRPEVLNFLKATMSCPLLQVYGQTQNTALATIPKYKDPDVTHSGGVVCSLEMKLCDLPQMNYTADDKDEQNRSTPRGEIWLRGNQIFNGYYKCNDLTKEAITEDGWLRTGDIGMIKPENNGLKIIDRKKNIFKLQQGEYVACEKVQAIYLKCDILTEIIIHGDSTQSFAIAIVVPDLKKLLNFAVESQAIKSGEEISNEQLCANKVVKFELVKMLNLIGKKEGLFGFQQAKNIYLDTEPFVNRNILTNTMKMIRHQARKFYREKIDKLYEQGDLLEKK